MIGNRRLLSVLPLVAAVSASQARAQSSASDVLSFLVTNQSVVTDNFVKDKEAAQATSDTISRFVQVGLSALPITSSAGGFIYRFNPTLGTLERVSDNFGPFYLERALTVGREQASIGFSYRHSRFDSLDGRSLRDGTLITTSNQLANESRPFDEEALTLRMDADTYTIFGSYGVTDRLEVGAAIPIVDLSLSGERLNRYRGAVFQQASGSAFVTGLSDVALRAKYSLAQSPRVGLAANVSLRLPTGDEEQLLGSGATAVQLSGVASIERGRVGAHVNGGVGWGGASDEITFGGAAVVSATQRLSLVGEVLGRRLSELARIGDATAPHPLVPNVTTTRLLPIDTGTTTVLALTGVKWNMGRTWIVSANVLVSLTDTGLTGPATPSIALDYSF